MYSTCVNKLEAKPCATQRQRVVRLDRLFWWREERQSRTLATRKRPLTAENEVVVTTTVDLLPCAVGFFPVFEADESVTLADTSLAVATDVDTDNTTEAAEENPEVLVVGIFAEVGDTEGGEFVSRHSAETAHLVSWALCATAHAGWNVFAACTCCNGRVGGVHSSKRSHRAFAALGSVGTSTGNSLESILVRTFCGEMVAFAKTTDDTLVGELLTHLVHVINLGFGSFVVAGRHLENHVLADRGGSRVRTGGFALFLAELCPVLAFGDLVLDLGLYKCPLDPSCDLFLEGESMGNEYGSVSDSSDANIARPWAMMNLP